jgi:hypothetical protein
MDVIFHRHDWCMFHLTIKGQGQSVILFVFLEKLYGRNNGIMLLGRSLLVK